MNVVRRTIMANMETDFIEFAEKCTESLCVSRMHPGRIDPLSMVKHDLALRPAGLRAVR